MRRNRIYEATIDDRTMRVAAANQQTALDLLSNAFPDATIGLTTVKDGNGKPVLTTDAGILDDLPTHDDGDADGALEGLAGTAGRICAPASQRTPVHPVDQPADGHADHHPKPVCDRNRARPIGHSTRRPSR